MDVRYAGIISMTAGAVLIITAASVVFYNINCDSKASVASAALVSEIKTDISEYQNENNNGHHQVVSDNYDCGSEDVAWVRYDSGDYIGILEIPTLDLELPVKKEWSYDALKVSPCRYSGTAAHHDLIIAAHNYPCHFGNLEKLAADETVKFTDVQGKIYEYRTICTEIIYPVDNEYMKSDAWDLSLFTCTLSGKSRLTVRCVKINNN
ncbi:MAG: sortase [Oscillospiraceae bacterium]|nr:sortase [Oscillospiraceae bacterium]